MSKKVKICICLVIIAAIICGLMFYFRSSSIFGVENDANGNITVVAQKAGKDASGMGYVTIQEGQKLEVRSNLTDGSSIKIEVLPKNIDATTKVLFEETFTAVDAREFELPAGEYSIRITAEKNATGTMDIKATGTAEEQTASKVDRTNSKLKTNEEIEKQITNSTQDYFEMVYADKINDKKINKIEVCPDDSEMLEYVDLAENDYAFEIDYEVKPSNEKYVSELTENFGEYDKESGWIKYSNGFGVMRYNEEADSFDITSITSKEDYEAEDNKSSEIKYSNLNDEEKIEHALFQVFKNNYGDQMASAKVVVDKIYTPEEIEKNEALKSLDIKEGELAFEVTIDFEPAEGADPNIFTIPNGEINEANGWVTNVHRLGILTPDEKEEYKIRNYGTGW
ncbi:MAG: hypothetical protein IKN74_01575 [Clostridia bacterium]|nr:hypothetical protein [Clostridia bacterium]